LSNARRGAVAVVPWSSKKGRLSRGDTAEMGGKKENLLGHGKEMNRGPGHQREGTFVYYQK